MLFPDCVLQLFEVGRAVECRRQEFGDDGLDEVGERKEHKADLDVPQDIDSLLIRISCTPVLIFTPVGRKHMHPHNNCMHGLCR